MELIFLYLGLLANDNAEFFKTVTKQQKDGYEWNYVGKQSPDGSPAITIKPEVGGEYILYKLKK
tara:strand:+ start:151 stop:342 length:192 start_codon:yes stop_codon:yes gene_type:complete